MAIHCLQKTQKLNLSISEVWDFISSPKNLKEITPDYMGFEILTDLPEKMLASSTPYQTNKKWGRNVRYRALPSAIWYHWGIGYPTHSDQKTRRNF